MKMYRCSSLFSILSCAALLAWSGLAGAATQIVKGPYLQNVTMNSIVVMWETDVAADSRVDFGTAAPNEFYVSSPTAVTIHEVTLPSLLANTVYYYKVTTSGTASATNSFITAPATIDVPFRFVAYGDTRTYPDIHAAVVQSIIPHQPDFVLHVGDCVQDGRIYSEWKPQFFDPAGPLIKNVPFFSVLGNHEYSGGEQMWYYNFMSLPNNERWYAFNYGCARFVALNVCDGGDAFTPGSAQYTWLTNELNSAAFTGAKWQFIWFHNPPYTAQELDGTTDQNVRAYLVPLFEQHGVDIVFNGDDHQYRHSLRNGIHYVVTGGGGAPLHDLGTPMPDATVIYAEKTYEHCVIDVTTNIVNFYAARTNGTVMDSFSLTNSGPTPPPVPTGLTATPGNARVTLNWNASAGATSYNVKRSTGNPSGPYSPIATGATSTTYTDTNVVNGTTYYYVVSAVNANGESADSTYVGATPQAPPAAPANLTAATGTKRGQIKLAWNASSGATSYNVKRSTTSGGPYTTVKTGVTSATYTDSKLTSGRVYYYVVSAVNAGGESPNSNQASAPAK